MASFIRLTGGIYLEPGKLPVTASALRLNGSFSTVKNK